MRTRSFAKQAEATSVDETLAEQKPLIVLELGEILELGDTSFARSLHHDLASDSAIDSFLKKSRFYNLTQHRWRLPRNYTKLLYGDFYTPFCNIFSSILRHFWRNESAQGTRRVVDTHNTPLRHSKAENPSLTSRPSLVIKAEGPSFQLPDTEPGQKPAQVGFSNVAACIELRAEGDNFPVSEQLVRVAIYARQLFIHQPNRRFVRILVLTGAYLRLFHFDRSGAQYTPPLDINADPHTFVRLVLGLSSPNEADIGLDTSIQWRIENGRKVSGMLTTRGADENEIVYPLLHVDALFSRTDLSGRCTTCWSVSNPINGEELLVKDSWRSCERTPEFVYLEEALGISGVAQMVSYEPDRCQAKDLRGFGNNVPAGFENRINTRVVMKCYGPTITKFSSAQHLLCILRDAISAHRKLLRKGILHGDVSIQNILTGSPKAEPGHRGVLIDLDIASRYIAGSVNALTDWRVGTSLYQSIMVVLSGEFADPLVHDHLDELESFFYVFSRIIHAYDCHGVFHSMASDLKGWEKYSDDQMLHAACKRVFIVEPTVPREVSARWPEACLRVFHDFRDFIKCIVVKKLTIAYEKPEDRAEALESLWSSAEDHYNHVLGLFDEGIAALGKAELGNPATSPSRRPATGPVRPPMEQSPLKRPSDDYPEAQPTAKRSTSPRITRNARSPRSPSPCITPRSA
ncbi:hypothetical protein EST38_g13250 [Candolleomyces aberdarensis]|uniref:Fungal-type protein kinase domain-containing protein n=1 Tax=Candolleomyces aberdarensis TaxID=2316362 RepID=A0A4Q2D0E1_9AGAR|nr:hypothetical protein EST38_g13250 [Candolleomyces aberdarensis]